MKQIAQLCQNKDILKDYGQNAYEFAYKNFGEENFKHSYRHLLLETPKKLEINNPLVL